MEQLQPKLGDWITIKAQAIKCRERLSDRDYPLNTSWQSQPMESCQALYIGKRVVKEGVTELDSTGDWEHGFSDEYTVFYPNRHLTVYVVVLSERHNPIYVFPEDVEV